ncbi:MAG: hypothetical protein MOGMAGMI_00349 [Candidatus Omnitrophica bacterium]|nr:hypothetical protein [Candidatus Omnitrophota bacterium]
MAEKRKEVQSIPVKTQESVSLEHLKQLESSLLQRLNGLTQACSSSFQNILTRLLVLETLVQEKSIASKEELISLSERTEDLLDGIESVEVVEKGDVIRVTVQTRFDNEQGELAQTSYHKIYDIGHGKTFELPVEEKLIGLKKGEQVRIDDKPPYSILITVNSISRKKQEQGK